MGNRPSLPINQVLPELRQRLTTHNALVLQAPPGAGKTTLVPLEILSAPWLTGRIIILEPRRLAARAAAARMAEILDEQVGDTVGYRIRFDQKVSARTRIEVVTEGILSRRLQSDPTLTGISLVIFDEFHERHLHTDLALALCTDVQRSLRPDLKLLIMSATLETAPIARLLNEAPVIRSEGRSFPVDVHYAQRDPLHHRLAEAVADCVTEALHQHPGDVLVFLPGTAEIRRANALLAQRVSSSVVLHALYGDLPKKAQDHAILPDAQGRRKVVLATPIAESSLTIEGVRIVVDSGLRRVPRFDARSGLTRLETVRIAQDAADQRTGRAGRTGPGVCYRLWSSTTQSGLTAVTTPEILHADLTELALELALWGVRDPSQLMWLNPPPSAALAQARVLLQTLGALDGSGQVTGVGRRLSELPVHPRLGRMLVEAQSLGLSSLACDIAALLSERDPFAGRAGRSVDLTERVEALLAYRQKKGGTQAESGVYEQIERLTRDLRRAVSVNTPTGTINIGAVGRLLAYAYPDRIAMERAPRSRRYLLTNGRGAQLIDDPEAAHLPFLVAAQLDAGAVEAKIYLAAPIALEDVYAQFQGQIEQHDVVRWDHQRQAVAAHREQRLGALILKTYALENPNPHALTHALMTGIREMGLQSLPWTETARQLQARIFAARHWLPTENWPEVADAQLLQTLETWLEPYLAGITTRAQLARLDMHAVLLSQLDWRQRTRLDEIAPTHLVVPSGTRVALDYRQGDSPVLAVKLQELFGLNETPRVAAGKVPVTLHLLSPARRPIQVTQDLRGFWERTYTQVKKELKGRYPKHPWPDDPWSATPTAKIKRGKG